MANNSDVKYLFVDLDNTLIKGDLLWDQLTLLMLRKPYLIPSILLKIYEGPLALKQFVASRVIFDAKQLLYRDSVIEEIRAYKNRDYIVILASAAVENWVRAVSEHLKLFDGYIGSTHENLKGNAKLIAMKKLSSSNFTYIGDSVADHAIWRECDNIIAVNPRKETLRFFDEMAVSKKSQDVKFLNDDRNNFFKSVIKCLRPHQWAKNLLLLLPLILSHQISDLQKLIPGIIGLVCFSLAASAVYTLNDLLDFSSDRVHPTKRNRPIAAGKIMAPEAAVLHFILIVVALLGSTIISWKFFLLIGLYYGINIAYTFKLKKVLMLDSVLLSSMYGLRIFAGGIATETILSQWLLVFSVFFFLALALLKRFTETDALPPSSSPFGRAYYKEDSLIILNLGISCSMISTLILGLYIHSTNASLIYAHPQFLWLWIPISIYWHGRMWFLARRGLVDSDPVLFALKDKVSWIVGTVMVMVAVLSSLDALR